MILTLYLTMNCNQRCSYCYAKPHREADMELETAKKAIAMAAARLTETGGRNLGIRFFGGEPLLVWEKVPPLVEYGRKIAEKQGLDVSFAIATNGTLLSEEHCDFFLEHDFAVGLSIDGSKEVHDRNRRWIDGSGTFERTVDNARMAVSKNVRAELVLVSDPSTVGQLAASVKYLHEETGGYFFTISFNIHDTWNQEDMAKLGRSYCELADLYIEYFRKGTPIQIDFINNKINVLLRGGFIREFLCEIGKTDLAVTPEGNVYPCLRLAAMDPKGLTIIGTVANGLQEGLITALRTAVDRRYEMESLPPECHHCVSPESCLNWCAAANLAMTGNPARVGELMCRHERLTMDIARRIIAGIDTEKYKALYADYLEPFLDFNLSPATPHGEVGVHIRNN